MLRRLRPRRSLWVAALAGILAAPALFGGVAAAPGETAELLPPLQPDPRDMPPPDRAAMEAELRLALADQIADLAPEEYRMMVVDAARRHGVDPRLLAAMITVESQWVPGAVGLAGELGLMQILPATGAALAKELGLTSYNLADPVTNMRMGAHYLASLLQQYGSSELALAAYNGGPGAASIGAANLYARKVLGHYRQAPLQPPTLRWWPLSAS